MKTKQVKLYEDTYNEIIRKGGETFDDAIRRALKLPSRRKEIENNKV